MLLTHYTDKRNLEAIQKSGILKCALSLMTPSEAEKLACTPRWRCEPIECGAILRDQQPLLKRNPPPSPEEVKCLNEFVFFWANPQTNFQCRQFQRKYKRLKCFHLGLCCSLEDLRDANPGVEILCASRNTGGKESGIQHRQLQSGEEHRAVEVVAHGEVYLPRNTVFPEHAGR